MAPPIKNIIALHYRATLNLGGVCVMTFLDISSRLAVKDKKHILQLDGTTYEKDYRPILSNYFNLWGVCIMTFLDISNRLAVKHKKHISPIGGATSQKYIIFIFNIYNNIGRWHPLAAICVIFCILQLKC